MAFLKLFWNIQSCRWASFSIWCSWTNIDLARSKKISKLWDALHESEGSWVNKAGIEDSGNSRIHEHRGFEVFAEVRRWSSTGRAILNVILITLAVLNHCISWNYVVQICYDEKTNSSGIIRALGRVKLGNSCEMCAIWIGYVKVLAPLCDRWR